MGSTVRAATLMAPGKLEVLEYPRPALEEGALLVRTLLCGICGTDKHGYKGESVQYAGTPREIRGPYPAIPGHEIVAEIVDLRNKKDKGVTDFYGKDLKVGDRIVVSPDIVCGHCYWCRNSFGYSWCDNMRSYGHMDSTTPPHILGAWGEFMYVFPGSHIFKIGEEVPNEIAVLAEPMAVSCCLDIAKGQSSLPIEGFGSGGTTVIFGVGPLGLCHLIKARLLGSGLIIAIDRSNYRLDFARRYGTTHTLNIDESSVAERKEAILQLTSGRGADLIVECAGVPQAVVEGIELLRQGGTFVEVGHFVDTGVIPINPHRHFCAKNIRLIGQLNLAYTGIIPSISLMMVNNEKYDFGKIVSHRYQYTNSLDGLLKSMSLDSMKVAIYS